MPSASALVAEARSLTNAEKSAEEEVKIVQYNVQIGDKIGTLVKDSVVQRSNIGASARKCPNCGREVEANEKFCLECGAKL
jgi:rRNA maturation endonuclease Nob1